jgi:hypothetical protein
MQANYDPRIADSDRKAKEMGYRIVMRDGARYYCRTVAPMGTRIPQKDACAPTPCSSRYSGWKKTR